MKAPPITSRHTAPAHPCTHTACRHVPDLCTCGAMAGLLPAEACTELGAGTAPPRPSWWRRLRMALLRWELQCLIAERLHYADSGLIGPQYLRASYAQQRRLMGRIRELGCLA